MLRQRVITAVLLGPILIWVVLWAPSPVTSAVIVAALLIGAWEWSQFCAGSNRVQRIAYLAVVAGAMAYASYVGALSDGLSNILVLALLWWLVAFVWVTLAPSRVNKALAAVAGIFVLAPTWVALIRLHDVPDRGPLLVLFLLVLVFAADVGAYFAGRAFGRLKLAPRVSPGKTWEGVLGGFAAATAIALIGATWFALPLLPFLSLCGAVVAVSIVGDLTESMFKRHAGLKDSGTLLPGHGGILDRIDSITGAAPIFALGMIWMGVLL